MKSLTLFIFIIQFCVPIQSQSTFYSPAIIYSLSENTIVKINDKKIKLDSLLICNYNEQLEVIEGKVGLFNGEDIELKAGKKISIVKGQKLEGSNMGALNVYKVSRFMNEPAVYLPNLYNSERNYFAVFPLKSKVYDASNIKIYFPRKLQTEIRLKLYCKDTDSLIWQTNNPAEKVNLKNITLIDGKTYSWMLYNGSNCAKGEFELLSNEQIQSIKISTLQSKADYLNTFFLYLENNCKFDAIANLSEAIKKYPKCKIFKNIADKIPIDIE